MKRNFMALTILKDDFKQTNSKDPFLTHFLENKEF